jgi:competence protein ComEC
LFNLLDRREGGKDWRPVLVAGLVWLAAWFISGNARAPASLSFTPQIDAVVEQLHEGLRQAALVLEAGSRALVPALVVGDTSALSVQIESDFKATGLTHLVAVSGANLTILLGFVLALASRLGVRGWWLRLLSAATVVGFVILCKGEPSVIRAAAMGTVGLLALGLSGPAQGLRFLSWAVVGVLVVSPVHSHSLGFALSVSATMGIILWAGPWAEGLAGLATRAVGRVRTWLGLAMRRSAEPGEGSADPGDTRAGPLTLLLAEAVTVPLAAQVATEPLITTISGQLSVVGVFANLAAAPLVAPATVCGFIALFLAVVAMPLASVFALVAGVFANGLLAIAHTCAGLPQAAIPWPSGALGPALSAALAAAMVLLLAGNGIRWLPPLLLALAVLTVRVVAPPGWPPAQWQVVSCSVGQGDATVLNAGGGKAVLVDAGPEPRLLKTCLEQLGVQEVPLVVLTHLHADHITGVSALGGVRQLLVSDVREPASGWALVRGALPQAEVVTAKTGMRIGVGEVSIEILAALSLLRPPVSESSEAGSEYAGESSEENNASLVLRATVGTSTGSSVLSILMCGDLESEAQLSVALDRVDLRAEVFLVPHHGSSSQSEELWKRVGAAVALIGVGKGNSYGHPTEKTLALARSYGMVVYRTDLNGSIAVAKGTGLNVYYQRE